MDPIPHDDKKEVFTPVISNPLAEHCKFTVSHHSCITAYPPVAGTHEPIPIEEFADHVRMLHANDDYLFTEEYRVHTLFHGMITFT